MPAQSVASTVDLITTCRDSGFVQHGLRPTGGKRQRLNPDLLAGNMLTLLILAVAVTGCRASFAAGPDDLSFQLSSSLSPQVLRVFENDAAAKRYALISHLNPFYVHGDFNGDGRTDTAVLVKNRDSRKTGIAIVHAGAKSAIILGAGRKFGNGGDDFNWMDAWHLYPRGVVERGADESAPPTLWGDALMVIKTESASALVYWNGKRYAWYQQGD
ncbi:MAG: hypothetical protein L0387_21270 [Acidobacteria bacterium]|nr:hypothetical protein [Acidobacteriota bacterium]MCI0717800.1 hypothetical protein [Acidobacteriota bacterium]